MAEDELAEIYNDFVVAQEARDEAMESLTDAISALRSANSKYNAAMLALAEFLGEEGSGEGVDSGDIFSTITGGGLRLTDFSASKLFGDLF